mmetsp:Transcript_12071/g.33107  ORF Transcript_12071/g.33107 Transcript_12071/m.33107 type:complete len:184 (-) Transcript_12071:116-667(-)|eukprot:CAMPEP_0179164120 /NCGR_PEP_ID=MMETSP0796-20121207/80516_1 /TAXON_ID=73915 /ORGANISM="Pyrodinium bahamense, Strain pbaha01" /LENGTH=183 /DNA_ID=CAMNT_0020866521 /DNA_START=100 /DNA_END=648 /DNA_ORIENTATION=-
MPASTYPDLVVTYPPAQRHRSDSASRLCSSGAASSAASSSRGSARGSKQSTGLGSSASAPGGRLPVLLEEPQVGKVSKESSRAGTAPVPPKVATQRPVVKPTVDLTRHLRLHPIQCGHPSTLKTCYSDLDQPISLARDPKWSTDLARQSQDMRQAARMKTWVTAGFLPSPVPYVPGARAPSFP